MTPWPPPPSGSTVGDDVVGTARGLAATSVIGFLYASDGDGLVA